jgi:hypothetical protein
MMRRKNATISPLENFDKEKKRYCRPLSRNEERRMRKEDLEAYKDECIQAYEIVFAE